MREVLQGDGMTRALDSATVSMKSSYPYRCVMNFRYQRRLALAFRGSAETATQCSFCDSAGRWSGVALSRGAALVLSTAT